jgi:hypothetical protein
MNSPAAKLADNIAVLDIRNIVERLKRGETLSKNERQALARFKKQNAVQSQRAASAERSKRISIEEREIGPLPACANPTERAACAADFARFCKHYMPETFTMAWSPDHLTALHKTQTAVIDGGLFALAMPRGSGKTSMVEAAVIWSLLYGHRKFVAVIGSDEQAALVILDSIKSELENNERLAADFPEVCHPIRALEGISHRCRGQLLSGKRTQIDWMDKALSLPTVDGSVASGAVIRTAGITGRVRGMKYKLPDGRTIRPDFVVVDDPQTDESARSPSQSMTREAVVSGAILGLAGPGKKISGIMPCTVIYPGDMADKILNRDIHPEWQGERTKLVYAWPVNTKHWDKYAELRRDGLRNGDGGKAATEYYAAHRDEMDLGAKVAWEDRKNPDELSAIQNAMNLRIDRGEAVMASEYQNEPLRPEKAGAEPIDTTRVSENRNGLTAGVLPSNAEHLVGFIDIQQQVVFYAVVAWSKEFTGAVVEYGAFPDQRISYYTLHDLRHTFSSVYKGQSIDAGIYSGLTDCVNMLNREWKREDGVVMRMDKIGIDTGYKAEIVHRFVRAHPAGNILIPTKGMGIKAGANAMGDWQRKRGEIVGNGWRYTPVANAKGVRHCIIDTNQWKSFLRTRLNTSIADPGALTLYSGTTHRMLLDHMASETPTETFGRGRRVEEWRLRHGGLDNHWLDCLVGCCVMGSVVGCQVKISAVPPVEKPTNKRQRERVRYL